MGTYIEFPKIFRFSRNVTVTEKIDGTNGLIEIVPYADKYRDDDLNKIVARSDTHFMLVGSRTRYITPQDDNYGFANWASKNASELFRLGEGRHHGEWWGQGIQRKYNLDEKRFSLFNTTRWADNSVRPQCCFVVPILWSGVMDELDAESIMQSLFVGGSQASLGFMKPEGIVIFHEQGNFALKKTFDKDDAGKGYGA